MKATQQYAISDFKSKPIEIDMSTLEANIKTSWSKVAPFWPMQNLIAVNPISGFEHLPFEMALTRALAYFQQVDCPKPMLNVNRISIKWFQAFFDQGQAVIKMPMRHLGLLASVVALLPYDRELVGVKNQAWLERLPEKPVAVIGECLLYLGIPAQAQSQFMSLMLTTLPGWSAHVQYRSQWANATYENSVTREEYLALRLIFTCLLWPEAKELLAWHEQALAKADTSSQYAKIQQCEAQFKQNLLQKLNTKPSQLSASKAQLVFCIDVRSEPFRSALEACGDYECFGFAGFFGVPVTVTNSVTGHSHDSCPVLLKPAHHIEENPHASCKHAVKSYQREQGIKSLYQSLKYKFATPLVLSEAMGLIHGVRMVLNNVSPQLAHKLQKKLGVDSYALKPELSHLSLKQKVQYAQGALQLMGLTKNFAPLLVLCGHGSTTQNNAYASALDCGACGGGHGAPNARILAALLNDSAVRTELNKQGIVIPKETFVVAAEHNTTTDEVELFDQDAPESAHDFLVALKEDLALAKASNSQWRAGQFGLSLKPDQAAKHVNTRALDWAQVRPEWGLSKNAAFVVGPRWLTLGSELEGRCFLHSYDWMQDEEGSSLKTILTAPMVVAQWINAQYLFSTLDNVAYGAGSKVTNNITGKIGMMQGNASDLMHGLPLQSVFDSDDQPYHEPMRLLVVVYAPRSQLDAVIQQESILQKLLGNGWVHLHCVDPVKEKHYSLQTDLNWTAF